MTTPTPTSADWTVARVAVDSADAAGLLREYIDDVASRYYRRQATDAEIDAAIAKDPNHDLVPPNGLFLVAHHRGSLAGCVGLRVRAPEIAEVTRMFVRQRFRGRGGASRLLTALEAEAGRLGITTLRLDTRHDLVEARNLYAKHGYVEVPPYAERRYADHWFEKHLAAPVHGGHR